MRETIIILCLMAIGFVACDEVGLEENSNTITYLGFEKDFTTDSIAVSFLFYPDGSVDYPVVLNILGKVLEADAEYTLSVIQDSTTLDAKNYKLPEKFTFRKGLLTDTAYIPLTNSAELSSGNFILWLQVDENDNFKKGPRVHQKIKMLVTDKVTRPAWWPEEDVVEWYYLGLYSDKKYELLLEVTDQADFGEASMAERRILALKLKRYVEEWNAAHPDDILMDEANNQPMTIPVAG